MVKLMVKYENEADKLKILEALSKGCNILSISKPYKSNKFYRLYIELE